MHTHTGAAHAVFGMGRHLAAANNTSCQHHAVSVVSTDLAISNGISGAPFSLLHNSIRLPKQKIPSHAKIPITIRKLLGPSQLELIPIS